MFPGIEPPRIRCGTECDCPRCNGIGFVPYKVKDFYVCLCGEFKGVSYIGPGEIGHIHHEQLGNHTRKTCPRCGGGGRTCKGHTSTLRKPETDKPQA